MSLKGDKMAGIDTKINWQDPKFKQRVFMPNSLIFALGITLLYIVVTFNRKVYDELYLKAMKIDILSGIMVSAWFMQ